MADVKQLIEQLGSSDLSQQRDAAQSLLNHDQCAEGAVELVRTISCDDELLVESANGVLETIETITAPQAAELAKLLADENSNVVYWAATLLGRNPEIAASHIVALVDALDCSESGSAKEKVVWALGKIGAPAVDAVAKLQPLTAHDVPRLARIAQQAIDEIVG